MTGQRSLMGPRAFVRDLAPALLAVGQLFDAAIAHAERRAGGAYGRASDAQEKQPEISPATGGVI